MPAVKKTKRRWVRQPRVELDTRPLALTHGVHIPVRGIWHTTEGHDAPGTRELAGVAAFWARQRLGYGAHIIIDKDGNSALHADPYQVTWHTRGRNRGSIGIELIGFARFTPKIWWTRIKQLNKLAKWMAWLNLEYGIPLKFDVDRGWSGHRDQPNQDHRDPGLGFLKKYVLRRARQFRAKGWT